MSTNVEGGQVLAVLIEGLVVEVGKLLCMLLRSSWPAQYRMQEAGFCSAVLHLRAMELKSERSYQQEVGKQHTTPPLWARWLEPA